MRPDGAAVSALRESLDLDPVIATLLANRRISTPEQAHAFLNPSISQLRPPTGLRDLEAAVQRLSRAVTTGETILLFGDYDVDGTTATAVLYEFLKSCGARVSYYIPHRLKEGYGFQVRHIAEVAAPQGAKLIITVDCGSSSHEAVDAARAAQIDVIITDHHTIGDSLPRALAVVNPKRRDCSAGLDQLAGVGVAFCLVIALRKRLRELGFWGERKEPNLRSLCDLVALGTITDMVPLLEENRILAKTGLDLIGSGRRPGLAALMEASGISERLANSEDVAFRLGPRLNAAGRIDHAALAVELLTSERMETARPLAQALNELNIRRQDLERRILTQLNAEVGRQPGLLDRRSLVLAHSDWHEGVIGIVASKVMEQYYRPVVLIALREQSGRGSARSIPGIDMFACLSACRGHLQQMGGHTQAAGLQISADQIAPFSEAFELAVRQASEPEAFIPQLWIDMELNLDAATEDLADQLETLMPFGAGNPEPLFMTRKVAVISSSWVGQSHRRMLLRRAGDAAGPTFRAIHFHADPRTADRTQFDSMAFKLRWNRWNGSKTVQLVIEAVTPG